MQKDTLGGCGRPVVRHITPDEITNQKKLLRSSLLARRGEIDPADMATFVDSMVTQLKELPAFREARVICGYASVRGEPDLDPLWRAAAAAGKRYALPAVSAKAGEMVFRALPGYCPARLARGRFGIPEPPTAADCPPLALSDLRHAVMVVPALSFDRDGYRLGYGGGYYDRLISAARSAEISLFTVGLCPTCLMSDTLPREAHDLAVDYLIDERSVTFTHGCT